MEWGKKIFFLRVCCLLKDISILSSMCIVTFFEGVLGYHISILGGMCVVTYWASEAAAPPVPDSVGPRVRTFPT